MATEIRAVVFDVGETLLDESRAWSEWARWLGVSDLTLAAVLGATIARGRDHIEALRIVRPGFDLAAERRARSEAGLPDELRPADLYPDALPCIAALREMGLVVGAAGNTGVEVERFLRASCGVEPVASSAGLGVASRRRSSSPRSPGWPASSGAGSPTSATGSTMTCCRRWPRGWWPCTSAGDRGGTFTPGCPKPRGPTSASSRCPSSRVG